MFYDECDEWYDNPRVDKTWVNFQAHFQDAQRKHKRNQIVSTRDGGYHGASILEEAEDTQDELINLATAAVADLVAMMTHNQIIAELTATISALTQKTTGGTCGISETLKQNYTSHPTQQKEARKPQMY